MCLCVCLSLVFSTPLHKIPPSLFSIPCSLSPSAPPSSLSLVSWSAPQSHKLVLASSKWLQRERGNRGSQHQSLGVREWREDVGDDLQFLCSTLTGLNGCHTLIISDYLCSLRLSCNSMSSSSASLHNKRLPCKLLLKPLHLWQKVVL